MSRQRKVALWIAVAALATLIFSPFEDQYFVTYGLLALSCMGLILFLPRLTRMIGSSFDRTRKAKHTSKCGLEEIAT